MIMHINLSCQPEFGVSPSFNISDLKSYLEEEDDLESRTTPIQEGEDDEDITSSDAQDDPPLDIQGPITRARARQINLRMSLFLSKSFYNFENRLLPNNYIMLRNHTEDQGMHKGWLGGMEGQQGRPGQGGGPNRVDFKPVSESRTSEE